MSSVQVLFFSVLREKIGCGSVEVELERSESADRLLDRVVERYPAIRPFRPTIRIAVNRTYVEADHVVQSGDEIALITPVSGG